MSTPIILSSATLSCIRGWNCYVDRTPGQLAQNETPQCRHPEFAEFRDDKSPTYAIASYRWQGEEVTYQEVNTKRNTNKKGYQKVRHFAKYVQKSVPTFKWLWIDTCCINKDSAAELSEAINLIFKWYRNVEVCLAYLTDVDTVGDQQSFQKSEWFERG